MNAPPPNNMHMGLPEGWRVLPLQQLCREQITYGIVQCGPHVVGGIPYVRVSDMNSPELDVSSMLCTSTAIAGRFARSTVAEGDLVYALRGKLGEVRKVGPTVAGANLTQGTARLAPRTDVASDYLLWAMQSPSVLRQAELVAKGSTFVELTLSSLRQLEIPLPNEQEQQAIASALSDVDALIAGLERLIAKKRDIKQAAMQQLLTGQTRLPGFSGAWVSHRLGDSVQFLKNGVNARAELTETGHVRYLHYGDIHGATAVFLDVDRAAMPYLPASKAAKLDRLQDGDLIFADASEDKDGIGKSVELRGVGKLDVVSGLHTIAARFDKEVLADGFKAYLPFMPPFSQHLKRLAAGTKVYATNRSHIASVELKLPGGAEQSAIVAILSDMDTELTALESRLAKTSALKQGMMQDLLTGRTRLV